MLSECSAFHWIKPSSTTRSFQSTRAVGSWARVLRLRVHWLCCQPSSCFQGMPEMLWGWPEWQHTLNAWDVLDRPGLTAGPRGHVQSLWTPAWGGYPQEMPRRSRAASSKHNSHAALTPQLHAHRLLVHAKLAAAFENIPWMSQQSLEELFPLQCPWSEGSFPSQGKESESCGWRGSQHPESSSNCCF